MGTICHTQCGKYLKGSVLYLATRRSLCKRRLAIIMRSSAFFTLLCTTLFLTLSSNVSARGAHRRAISHRRDVLLSANSSLPATSTTSVDGAQPSSTGNATETSPATPTSSGVPSAQPTSIGFNGTKNALVHFMVGNSCVSFMLNFLSMTIELDKA